MGTIPYVELHCHSAFSLLEGASIPRALIERAVELGLSGLALTDRNDMGGIVRLRRKLKNATIFLRLLEVTSSGYGRGFCQLTSWRERVKDMRI